MGRRPRLLTNHAEFTESMSVFLATFFGSQSQFFFQCGARTAAAGDFVPQANFF